MGYAFHLEDALDGHEGVNEVAKLLKITDKQCQGDCGGIAVWMVFGVDFHDFRIAACHGV